MENPFDKIYKELAEIKQLVSLKDKEVVEKRKPTMNIDELCNYLPNVPAPSTIYNQIKNIPHSKIFGRLVFYTDEIDKWYDSKRIKSNEELKNEMKIKLTKEFQKRKKHRK